jgi:hypothetical protein
MTATGRWGLLRVQIGQRPVDKFWMLPGSLFIHRPSTGSETAYPATDGFQVIELKSVF